MPASPPAPAGPPPLLTPEGAKPIEQFHAGDLVLSRSEFDPTAPVEAKQVEEVFVRVGRILHLHVGGQVICTTPEHPFWVYNKGWLPAGQLQVNDRLLGAHRQWTAVDDLHDTGEHETVYNTRVAEWHTYFVGDPRWQFSLWAHNDYKLTKAEAEGPSVEENQRVATQTDLLEAVGVQRQANASALDTVEAAAQGPENPYKPGGAAHARFEAVKGLVEAGVPGAPELLAKLIERQTPNGPRPAPGYAFQADRALAYPELGVLEAIEPPTAFPKGLGQPDLQLTLRRLVETKAWNRWADATPSQQEGIVSGGFMAREAMVAVLTAADNSDWWRFSSEELSREIKQRWSKDCVMTPAKKTSTAIRHRWYISVEKDVMPLQGHVGVEGKAIGLKG